MIPLTFAQVCKPCTKSTRTRTLQLSDSPAIRYVGVTSAFPTLSQSALQFGGQEPGTDEEIANFCVVNHGVTFPLMKKSDVNGDNTNEVFKWLKAEKSGLLGLTRIKVCIATIFGRCSVAHYTMIVEF